jgi:hypothetical protein
LALNFVSTYGQRTYESTNDSFRRHYFLSIETDDKITLYGWEINETKDTLTFKALGHRTFGKSVTFDNFQFSKRHPSRLNIDQFKTDNEATVPAFFLHRHLVISTHDKRRIEGMMTKDVYDSNADKFIFVRRK